MSKTCHWDRNSTPEETDEILTILDGVEDLNTLTNVNVVIECSGLSGVFTKMTRNGRTIMTGQNNEWRVAGLQLKDPMYPMYYMYNSVVSLNFTTPDESPAAALLISIEQAKALDDARETLDQFGSANWKNHLTLVPTFRAEELTEGTIVPDGYCLMGLDRDNDEYFIVGTIEEQYIRNLKQWGVTTMYLLPMNPPRKNE